MRKYIIHQVVGLALLVAAFAGCDTASQEVEPTVSPDDYPVTVFETDFTGTSINEGDTIAYTITFDKPIDRSVTYSVTQTGGDAVAHHDWEVVPAVIQPWKTEAELLIIFPLDNVPEDDVITFQGKIEAPSLADKYLVNPSVVNPTVDVSIASVNDPTLLTVMLSWPTGDDIDIVSWSDTDDYPMTEWGDGGATGANPEIDMSIWLADPVGTYYVNFMHWGAAPFEYTLTFGHPDGTNQVISGTFDSDNLDNYPMDLWMAWGGDGYPSYRMITVENDGTKFTVTAL